MLRLQTAVIAPAHLGISSPCSVRSRDAQRTWFPEFVRNCLRILRFYSDPEAKPHLLHIEAFRGGAQVLCGRVLAERRSRLKVVKRTSPERVSGTTRQAGEQMV